MTYKPLGHSSLGTRNFNAEKTLSIQLEADVSSTNKIKFYYKSLLREEDPDRVPRASDFASLAPTKLLDIPIKEKCFVKILLLRGNLDWHWRPMDAITTVVSAKSLYKQLRYYKDGDWVADPGQNAICQAIRFGAWLRPGPEGPKDAFNMNVILEWDSGEVLPITIDPDLQNPKV